MADLKYSISAEVLTWGDKGRWEAVSGPHRPGVLPTGIYKLGRREVTPYSGAIASSFRDETGKGFFIPIYPTFSTDRGKTGGRLGIHPDGGVYGTRGCIGIRSGAASFYRMLAATGTDASLTLEVY